MSKITREFFFIFFKTCMRKIFAIVFLLITLSSCFEQTNEWKKLADKYSKEICNDLHYDRDSYETTKDPIRNNDTYKKYIVSCYERETDEEPVYKTEISDFKYYKRAKEECSKNNFSSVSSIQRIANDDWVVVEQKIKCHNKSRKDWFETEFSDVDHKEREEKRKKDEAPFKL